MKRQFTLRRRLIAGILVLLAAVSLSVGAVSTLALRSYLIDRLDDQIVSAASRFQGVVGRPGDPSDAGRPGPDEFLPLAGQAPGTVAAFMRDNQIYASVLGDDLDTSPLTIAEATTLLSITMDADPVTVDFGTRLGEYRIVAVSNSVGEVLVLGLPLRDVTATVLQLALVIAIVAALGLAAAFFAGTAIVRLALRPLDRVAATAAHVAELQLERGEVALSVRVPDEDADPSTEVGRVGAAINRMLGHVASALATREASERKVRTFVADASHELRTPLASIRGYSELTRRGGHKLPKDVVHALARIESESVRMTTLVEDLLLLARLDDGRNLEQQPVDLSQLLADVTSDAQAAGQDHKWTLALPPEPLLVRGDAARLHQVFANLAANARVHTPARTEVSVGARRVDASIEVTVEDNGGGIDPEVLPTVFERFARGDTSRSRVAGSTGLGLAIVDAVVAAHGGTVSVDSAAGVTVFTVRLPAAGLAN